MTKVICGYVMCEHNKSTVSGVPGECIKNSIKLKYVNKTIDHDTDDEIEALDCEDFEWCHNKKVTGVEKERL